MPGNVMQAREPGAMGVKRTFARELPSCRSFRDLGGIPLVDGGFTRPGLLYRSGRLSMLDAVEEKFLLELGIRKVVDLRTSDECAAHPDRIPDGIQYLSLPAEIAEFSLKSVIGLFSAASRGEADTDLFVRESYARMPRELVPLLRNLFALLLTDESCPMVVHCTGGKDRTGFFSAIFLYAMGADDDRVMDDYLMSGHQGADLERSSIRYAESFRQYGVIIEPEKTYPLLTTRGDYLSSALQEITEGYGSVLGYLEREIHITPNEITRLRGKFVSPA